jgi:hypothetical protein
MRCICSIVSPIIIAWVSFANSGNSSDANRSERKNMISKIMQTRAKRKIAAVPVVANPSDVNSQVLQQDTGSENAFGEAKSGIVLPDRQATSLKERQNKRGESSLANNDSKEIVSKVVSVYQRLTSRGDIEVIENAIQKDEERERELMAEEDTNAHVFSPAPAVQALEQCSLETGNGVVSGTDNTAAKVDSLPPSLLQGSDPETGHGLSVGCCAGSQPSSQAQLDSRNIRSPKIDRGRVRVTIPEETLGSANRKLLALSKEASDRALVPEIRPAVLAAIENDMRGFTGPVAVRSIRQAIFLVKRWANTVWDVPEDL